MRSRLLLNLVMAALAIGLGAYLLWVPAAPEVAPPYPGFDADAATTLRIERIDAAPIALVRREAGWRMVEPFDAAADAAMVQRILSRSPPPVHRRYALGDLDLSLLALEPPEVTLDLDGAHFAFGTRAPMEGYRYMLADDAVFLADQTLPQLLAMGAAALVDKHPVAPGSTIDRLELPDLVLTRTEIGWSRDPDDGAASDADQAIVDGWTNSQAINVNALPQTTPEGLIQIGLGTADGTFRELWVDPEDDALHLYDLDGGLVYEMPGDLRPLLLGQERAQAAPEVVEPADPVAPAATPDETP